MGIDSPDNEEESERKAGERIWAAVDRIEERRRIKDRALGEALADLLRPPAASGSGPFDLDEYGL
ncbi:hypothetical protein ACUXV3_12200 [Roseobacteraceae bacterium NS-SX3]